MIDYYVFADIVMIFISIFLSAFFAMSETAVISTNRIKIYNLEKKNQNAKIIKKFLDNPEHFITAILICNNIVNVFASVLAGHLAVIIFGDLGVAIATVVMTFLILVAGDIIPKRLGARHPEKISLRLARILNLIVVFFHPLVTFFIFVTDWVVKFFGERGDKIYDINRDEIKNIVSMGKDLGAIKDHEKKIIHRVLDLTDKKIKQIMVPRKKIRYVNYSSTLADAIKIMIKFGYTRLPVYKKNKVVGIVHARDFFKYSLNLKTIRVSEIIRKVLFVDENDTVTEVMRRLQKSRQHIAIVMKNNKVAGLISIEDIFVETVGKFGK